MRDLKGFLNQVKLIITREHTVFNRSKKFLRDYSNAMSGTSPCENVLSNDIVCDYYWGHQGMHAHHLKDGVWVWSTDKHFSEFLKAK